MANRFYIFTNFIKNVLEYRNRSKFVRRPTLTYSTIWVKNIWGSGKKLIPYFQDLLSKGKFLKWVLHRQGWKMNVKKGMNLEFLVTVSWIYDSVRKKVRISWGQVLRNFSVAPWQLWVLGSSPLLSCDWQQEWGP